MRWVVFVASFFAVVLVCFWTYTWNHREEFLQTAFTRLYPSYAVTVGSILLEADGTATIVDITLYPKQESRLPPAGISKIIAKASYFSWMRWALMPEKFPLHLSLLSIQGKTSALPADIFHPSESFIQADSFTLEETET